jgi:hypothetical protein
MYCGIVQHTCDLKSVKERDDHLRRTGTKKNYWFAAMYQKSFQQCAIGKVDFSHVKLNFGMANYKLWAG